MLTVERLNTKFKSKWKWLAGSLTVLGVLAWYQFYFMGIVEVETATAALGTIGTSVEEVGYVQADEEYDVLAPVTGYIGRQPVERGQEVGQAQILMFLDSPDTDLQQETTNEALNKVVAELDNARNNRQVAAYDLADAEKNLARKEGLLSTGAISQADYDGIKLSVDRFRSQVSAASDIVVSLERQLSALKKRQVAAERKTEQLVIKSPVAGTVLYLPLKAGQLAVMGTTLAKIGQKGPTKVYVDIISDDMRYVALGQKVTISSPALEKPLTGIVSQIYPQAYEKTSALGVEQRRVRVIANLERRENLQSGYEVKVTVDTQSRDNVLLVPREAIVLNPQGEYEVWIVNKQQQVESRKVKVGLKNRVYAEICDGLQAGDTVIVGRKGQIGEKTRVNISKRS
ncbi:MAG: Multidrug resistance efflux pump-like protein [Firmicutes bacterium]|nr:Multidrug resistance efflux pump-like protein [Bacillota bacterium]